MTDIQLPPLPHWCEAGSPFATHMQAYARAAIEAHAAQKVPVAWRTFDGEGGYEYRSYEGNEKYAEEWANRNPRHSGWVEPLYTHPAPVREPLLFKEIWDSDQIMEVNADAMLPMEIIERFVRAIEAAHGITMQSNAATKDGPLI